MARILSFWRDLGPGPWRAHLRKLMLLVGGALAWSVALAQVSPAAPMPQRGDGELVLGRYTTSLAQPPVELAQPLDVVVAITFPRSTVATVGEAVQHALLRSGYRLAHSDLAEQAQRFLLLPLPESQRQVGPYRLQAVLDLLVGSAWHWHADHAQRRVWFSSAQAQAASATDLPLDATGRPRPIPSIALDDADVASGTAQTFPVAPPAAVGQRIE